MFWLGLGVGLLIGFIAVCIVGFFWWMSKLANIH